MLKRLTLLLLFLINSLTYAQRLGVNPFFVLDGKFSIQYEKTINYPRTYLVGGVRYYSVNYGLYSNYFSRPVELDRINDLEVEQGLKYYLSQREKVFISVLGNISYTSLQTKKASFISEDSISVKGLVIGPEARIGIDFRLFRGKILIQPSIGVRRRFSLINFDNLTYDDRLWRVGTSTPSNLRLSRFGATQIRNQPVITGGVSVFVDLSKRGF
jgi:hypothetical protein